MKNILYSLALFGILFTACGDEFEEVKKENVFPSTQSLINAYVQGTVSNLKGEPLDSIRVDLLVDGEILASTITNQGFYFFIDVAAHETKTMIRAHSKQYAPNFKTVKFDDEYSSQVENITIEQFLVTKEQANLAALTLEVSPDFNCNLLESSFETQVTNSHLGALTFDYRANNRPLVGIKLGLDGDGNEALLSFQQVYYLGAYNLENTEVILSTVKDYMISVPVNGDLSLWTFDIALARWLEFDTYVVENDFYLLNSNNLTYFAFVTSDCSEDIEPPVSACVEQTDIYFEDTQTVYAKDFDNGSLDNCSDSLDFSIKRLLDNCNIDPDEFMDSIQLCPADIGSEWPILLKVTDESGNADSCFVLVKILDTDCNTDFVPPVLILNDNTTITLRAGTYETDALSFDNGSYDECGGNVYFKIKKLTDQCNNGSDAHRDFVKFCEEEGETIVALNVLAYDENGNAASKNINVSVLTPDCSTDTTRPVAIIGSTGLVLTNGHLEVDYTYIDKGSYDLCSPTLDFKLKKSIDICNNGSDEYAETITFCEEERGKSVFVYMTITDESDNTSLTGVSLNVFEEDCINDSTPPRISVADKVFHSLSSGKTITPEHFITYSKDYCSKNLEFIISKSFDSCNGGFDIEGSTIEICDEELGEEIQVVIKVCDEASNCTQKYSYLKVLN